MREHRRDRGRLEDILKYGQNVEQIVKDITFQEFVDDLRIYFSTMKNIEIIGEAASMLTRHFREVHDELPWRQIAGMRNILVHGYSQVSDEDLWQTAISDIKPLCERVQKYLSDIDWDEWERTKDPYTETDKIAYKQAVETALRMIAKEYPVEDIAEITGLTIDEINALSGV